MTVSSPFFDRLKAVRKVVDRAEREGPNVAAIEPLLQDADVRREFFRSLDSSEWIIPLYLAHYFDEAPVAIVSETGTTFPAWEESRYLARMAKKAPDCVIDIFKEMSTNNPTVIGDMIAAALAVSAECSAILISSVIKAARSGSLWVYFKDAVELCMQLGRAGHVSMAVDLADALFAPRVTDDRGVSQQRDQYWYREGLRQIIPMLAEQAGAAFFLQMCNWLQTAIQSSEKVDKVSGDDGSYVWRPAIEEHAQNSDYRVSAELVGFVRQGFELAIRASQLTLLDALTVLDGYSFLVFKRLRLHLVGEFAEQAPQLLRQVALDRDLFEDYRFKHEYAVLIGKRFGLLNETEKAQWFEWIDHGPDMTKFAETVRAWHDREPTEQEITDRIEYWQFEKLHLIHKHLTGERLSFYQRMLRDRGEPQMADLNVRSGPMRWGSESPFSVEELSAMAFAQAVEMVSSWKGERDSFEGPDLEGLASAFERYVATNPTAFATDAILLVGRPAIFVRAYLRKISDAIGADPSIGISSLLDLCKWVIHQPVTDPRPAEGQISRRGARDWQWTRDEITRLIQSIVRAENDGTPTYPLQPYRDELWALLNQLYRGPEHSYIVHDKSNDDPRASDYLDMAINSPRGKAVEVALEYARWVANQIKVKEGEREVVPSGFAAMPEVREMLEWQIAQDNRTAEALTIIGWKIPLLNWIDKRWLGENADRIFDLAEIEKSPQEAPGWAAWNAFVVWVSPHIQFYKLFKSQFAYAVQQCARVPLAEQSRRHPMNHLGEHLMLLYGRGQLGLDDDGGLFRKFLTTANADVRRHAIGFVGQTLERDKDVPAEIRDRFMWLWDYYWSTMGEKDAKQRPNARLFGSWFLAELFPNDWALTRLEAFVKVTGTAEPDDEVVKKLSKLAPSDPARAIKILDHLARNDREGWKIHGWREFTKEIIKPAVSAGDEAQAIAVGLIDYLGRRGFLELGELLPR